MSNQKSDSTTTQAAAHTPAKQAVDQTRPQAAEQASAQPRSPRSPRQRLQKDEIVKFLILIGIGCVGVACVIALWPQIMDLFAEGGVNRLVQKVQQAGSWGVLCLLGLQLLQVIVAFIPGEVVQVAAGLMYGPALGALIIVVGAALSSAIVYIMVHKLGAPFVQKMVPEKYMNQIQKFEESNKFEVIVFILFFLPGMPKDAFTYLLPLTRMKLAPFLIITTLARTPGIVASTYATAGFVNGNIVEAVIIVAVVVIIALVGIIFQKQIVSVLGRLTPHASGSKVHREERVHGHREERETCEASASTPHASGARDASSIANAATSTNAVPKASASTPPAPGTHDTTGAPHNAGKALS